MVYYRPGESQADYNEKINSLGEKAEERYYLIWRAGKMGVIVNDCVLQEPTLTWDELWSVIQKDWEENY